MILEVTSLKVFCSEQSSSRGGIEIAQLVADWLIRLPIRTCVKSPITSDCSLAPKRLFVDWLKILANEKQAVQFRSPLVLVCEQKRCSHMPDVDFEASRRSTRVQSTIRSALFLAKH